MHGPVRVGSIIALVTGHDIRFAMYTRRNSGSAVVARVHIENGPDCSPRLAGIDIPYSGNPIAKLVCKCPACSPAWEYASPESARGLESVRITDYTIVYTSSRNPKTPNLMVTYVRVKQSLHRSPRYIALSFTSIQAVWKVDILCEIVGSR